MPSLELGVKCAILIILFNSWDGSISCLWYDEGWGSGFCIVLQVWERGPCTDLRGEVVPKGIWVFREVVDIGKKLPGHIGIVLGRRIELSVGARA